MNCPHCKARNPIGNKFCRECGQKLPLEENPLAAEEAQQVEGERNRERAAALLTQAFSLSQQDKAAAALPPAEEAAQLLPDSTSALTLCATLYERLGQNDKAIATMEKVVALNPDSTVDADRLDRLRRGVHLLPRHPSAPRPAPVEPEPRRWLALAAAVGSGLVVLGVGITLLINRNKNAEETPVRRTVPPVSATPNLVPPSARPNSALGPLSAPPVESPIEEATPRDPFLPAQRTTPQPRVPSGRPFSNPLLPNPGQGSVTGNRTGGTPPVLLPNLPVSGGTNGSLPPLGGVQSNPGPIVARPPQQNPSIPAAPPQNTNPPGEAGGANGPTEAQNPGFIRIRDHSSPGEGNTRSSAALPAETLVRAQTLQSSGKYREAISAYRDALSSGAKAGEVQQGIALCYQRLGEKISARAAYQQAIVAFQAQLNAGTASDQASRGLAACRAALDVLGHS